MDRNDSMMNQMRDLFKEVDADKSGTVSWKELKRNLNDDRVRAYFQMLSIDTSEAEGLFKLLDVDDSGEVGTEEFIVGCMRLKGTAKSIDLATMLYESKRMHTIMNKLMHVVEERFASLEEMLIADLANHGSLDA